MKKKQDDRDRAMVYSTDPDTMSSLFSGLNLNSDEINESQNDHFKQEVRVTLDKKSRGGKEVTLVKQLNVHENILAELATFLKAKCGVGGTAKDGEILIQGNHVEKVIKLMIEKGYKRTKKSGG